MVLEVVLVVMLVMVLMMLVMLLVVVLVLAMMMVPHDRTTLSKAKSGAEASMVLVKTFLKALSLHSKRPEHIALEVQLLGHPVRSEMHQRFDGHARLTERRCVAERHDLIVEKVDDGGTIHRNRRLYGREGPNGSERKKPGRQTQENEKTSRTHDKKDLVPSKYHNAPPGLSIIRRHAYCSRWDEIMRQALGTRNRTAARIRDDCSTSPSWGGTSMRKAFSHSDCRFDRPGSGRKCSA